MRNGVLAAPTLPASTISNGPTAKATRYDGSGFVSANRTTRVPPSTFSAATGVFESATSPAGTRSVSCHGTLNAGSSKQGKTRRASAASNWVTASGPAR